MTDGCETTRLGDKEAGGGKKIGRREGNARNKTVDMFTLWDVLLFLPAA